ncbi:MAG: bifunctional DNA-binding transcriptional regulator/O6-methylguanine-DNA methyltransferase Ada [Elainellaceae cyanobacterium]
MTLTQDAMWAAIATRDTALDGQFICAVVTTGIFCRPSCSARTPLRQNVRFYSSCEAAIAAGFRPCKRCRPTEASREAEVLADIARFIEAHADEKLTLASLASRAGLSVGHFQRVFSAAFGVSPKAYQEAHRLNRFKASLKEGSSVSEATYEAGYGSPSRVYGGAAGEMGMTPSAYRRDGRGEVIAYALRQTVLGPMLMAATERGVCFVAFDADTDALVEQLSAEFPKAEIRVSEASDSGMLDAWVAALDAHLTERAPCPDLPLDLRGTAFQMMVWRFLLSVKEGQTLSYGELAKAIGRPKAVRAAASACGANRVSVLVPCHRILRGDGGLGGYRWGLERKRSLLDLERLDQDAD